ncbi:hypothetical protein [Streptomyces chattanoogensis]|uniref:hypothetical protein n=1 Tax=Streptomyces chattanoogensis TaxID=66876 RepID=UPI003677DE77
MEAFEDFDPQRPFTRVKELVSQHLRRMNPRVEVVTTGFFNHSYAPDIVLRWPHATRTPDRYVYLRTTGHPDELREDMARLDPKNRPLLLSLGEFGESGPGAVLQAEASERQSLILDTPAFGALLPAQESPHVPRLVSGAVVEGGQGALDERHAVDFVEKVSVGVGAARAGEQVPTREAVEAVASNMSRHVADRLTTFLAALWQGGGATLASFPATISGLGRLDEATLAYLLSSDEVSDSAFWDRVLPLVNLPLLLRTSVLDPQNLQHLMRSAVGSWQSHVCMLVPGGDERTATGPWRWSVEAGRLWLQLPRFRVCISQTRKELDLPDEYPGPALDDLRGRADRFGVPLTSIRMLVTDRTIGYDGPGDDVAHDPRLDGISQALGQAEEVIEADAKTPSGTILRCIFSSQVATARGARSQVPLGELIRTTVQLMQDFSDSDADQLARLLGPSPERVEAPWDQPPLFGQ